eukprot:964661_1
MSGGEHFIDLMAFAAGEISSSEMDPKDEFASSKSEIYFPTDFQTLQNVSSSPSPSPKSSTTSSEGRRSYFMWSTEQTETFRQCMVAHLASHDRVNWSQVLKDLPPEITSLSKRSLYQKLHHLKSLYPDDFVKTQGSDSDSAESQASMPSSSISQSNEPERRRPRFKWTEELSSALVSSIRDYFARENRPHLRWELIIPNLSAELRAIPMVVLANRYATLKNLHGRDYFRSRGGDGLKEESRLENPDCLESPDHPSSSVSSNRSKSVSHDMPPTLQSSVKPSEARDIFGSSGPHSAKPRPGLLSFCKSDSLFAALENGHGRGIAQASLGVRRLAESHHDPEPSIIDMPSAQSGHSSIQSGSHAATQSSNHTTAQSSTQSCRVKIQSGGSHAATQSSNQIVSASIIQNSPEFPYMCRGDPSRYPLDSQPEIGDGSHTISSAQSSNNNMSIHSNSPTAVMSLKTLSGLQPPPSPSSTAQFPSSRSITGLLKHSSASRSPSQNSGFNSILPSDSDSQSVQSAGRVRRKRFIWSDDLTHLFTNAIRSHLLNRGSARVNWKIFLEEEAPPEIRAIERCILEPKYSNLANISGVDFNRPPSPGWKSRKRKLTAIMPTKPRVIPAPPDTKTVTTTRVLWTDEMTSTFKRVIRHHLPHRIHWPTVMEELPSDFDSMDIVKLQNKFWRMKNDGEFDSHSSSEEEGERQSASESESQSIKSESQSIKSESQSIQSGLQPVNSESQVVNSELQPRHSESQPVQTESDPVQPESPPGPVQSESQSIRRLSESQRLLANSGDSQPIQSEPQRVNSEPQLTNIGSQAANSECKSASESELVIIEVQLANCYSEPQPVIRESQPVSSEPQPVSSEAQPAISESQPANDKTAHSEAVSAHSEEQAVDVKEPPSDDDNNVSIKSEGSLALKQTSPLCPHGHLLVRLSGSGWACDALMEPCKYVAGVGETRGPVERFHCNVCDYDVCEECYGFANETQSKHDESWCDDESQSSQSGKQSVQDESWCDDESQSFLSGKQIRQRRSKHVWTDEQIDHLNSIVREYSGPRLSWSSIMSSLPPCLKALKQEQIQRKISNMRRLGELLSSSSTCSASTDSPKLLTMLSSGTIEKTGPSDQKEGASEAEESEDDQRSNAGLSVEAGPEPPSSLATRRHRFTEAELEHIDNIRKSDSMRNWRSVYEEMRSTFPDFKADCVSSGSMQVKYSTWRRAKVDLLEDDVSSSRSQNELVPELPSDSSLGNDQNMDVPVDLPDGNDSSSRSQKDLVSKDVELPSDSSLGNDQNMDVLNEYLIRLRDNNTDKTWSWVRDEMYAQFPNLRESNVTLQNLAQRYKYHSIHPKRVYRKWTSEEKTYLVELRDSNPDESFAWVHKELFQKYPQMKVDSVSVQNIASVYRYLKMGGWIEQRADTSVTIQEQSAEPSLCAEGSETVEVESEPASSSPTRVHRFTDSETEYLISLRDNNTDKTWSWIRDELYAKFPNLRESNLNDQNLLQRYRYHSISRKRVYRKWTSEEKAYLFELREGNPDLSLAWVLKELYQKFPQMEVDSVNVQNVASVYRNLKMGGGIERTDTSIKIQEQSAGPSLCVEGSETVEVESEPASCTSTRGHQFTEAEIEHIHKMRKRYPRPSWPSMHEEMRSTFPNFRADNVSARALQM